MTTTARRDFSITCFRRHPGEGYWTAHVTSDGQTFDVDRRNGSWRLWDDVREMWREVLPHVAVALQQRAREAERKENA